MQSNAKFHSTLAPNAVLITHAPEPVDEADRRRALRLLELVAAGTIASISFVLILWPRPPLWLDEAQSVAIARHSLPGLVDALRADGAPPIYYVLLHVWMDIFGESDGAVRSLSIICGLAAVGVLSRVAHELLGRTAAALTVLFSISHPYFVRYATEARGAGLCSQP